MNKFENVDVLASLQQIMQQNTAFFRNDFDIDKKILTRAAASKNTEDKIYLWFCRPNGTHCLRERDVFLRGAREHNTFRISTAFQALQAPNSPNGTHFMMEVSPYFERIASSREQDRLFAVLPYKSLCLSGMKDRHGVFALISSDEKRDLPLRRLRPSVRAQLKAGQRKAAAPKKTAAKTKEQDLEV